MLQIEDLTYRIGERMLLDGASVTIPAGERVGLIGRNGIGKSTLLALITGAREAERGRIEKPRRWRVGAVAQETPDGPASLIDTVLAADHERARLFAAAEVADGVKRAEIETRLADIGAYAAPSRAAKILAGLGFDDATQHRPVGELSGGWRMRVALAAALFAEPDLLLLDEPTNYLDLEGTIWFENYLRDYPHTALIVSHDRDLLNSAVNFILHLEAGKLTLYRGGYDAFERQRALRIANIQALKTKQDRERRHIMSFVDRFRAKATKARQAQSRLKALARLQPIEAAIEDATIPIRFAEPDALSPPILTLERVAVGYEAGRPVLQDLNLRIDSDDRVALLGANGNGKSTFAKLLAGTLAPSSGTIARARKLKVGYFAQHQLDALRPDATPFEHLRPLLPTLSVDRVRARLGAVGFSADKADRKVVTLSGGEKTRLLLALATVDAPGLLVLDEPTNHLDIDSREALIHALNDYGGAVVLISHDRHLLDACADRLWLVASGRITPYTEDLETYRTQILSSAGKIPLSDKPESRSAAQKATKAGKRQAAAEERARLAPLRRRVADVERTIARLTAQRAALDQALADPGLYDKDPARAESHAKERAGVMRALAAAEEEWLEAHEALDEALDEADANGGTM